MRSRSPSLGAHRIRFIAPVLLLMFLGLVGVGVEVWAQLGLVAVAQEAAHAAAVAPNAAVAVDQGTRAATKSVAAIAWATARCGYPSTPGSSGRVAAWAPRRHTVWGARRSRCWRACELSLEQDHVERVSQFRSFPNPNPAGSTTP